MILELFRDTRRLNGMERLKGCELAFYASAVLVVLGQLVITGLYLEIL